MRSERQILRDLEARIVRPQLESAGMIEDEPFHIEDFGVDPRYSKKYRVHSPEPEFDDNESRKVLEI